MATNPFFSQRRWHQIKSKVSIDKNNWFDDNVELTIEDANAAMKALIQTARDMQLPPTEFQNIMGRINKVAGMATDKVQGGADDFTRFATMLRSIKNFGNGDLWREYTNMISQLAGLRTNKDAEFKKMGWLPGTNDKEMNMSRWTLPNGIPVEQVDSEYC